MAAKFPYHFIFLFVLKKIIKYKYIIHFNNKIIFHKINNEKYSKKCKK